MNTLPTYEVIPYTAVVTDRLITSSQSVLAFDATGVGAPASDDLWYLVSNSAPSYNQVMTDVQGFSYKKPWEQGTFLLAGRDNKVVEKSIFGPTGIEAKFSALLHERSDYGADSGFEQLTADDSSFEGGLGSWSALAGCTMVQSSAQAKSGTKSVLLTRATSATAPSDPTLRATVGPSTTAALVSSSFTPAANSVLFVTAWGGSNSGAANSATIADSLAGTWTQIILRNFSNGSPAEEGYVQAWYRIIGGSPAAMTVTITDVLGTALHGGFIEERTNVDTTTPVGAIISKNGPATDAATQSLNIVTQRDQSKIAGAIFNWAGSVFSVPSGETVTAQQTGSSAGCSFKKDALVSPSGTQVTISVTRSSTLQKYHLIVFEIRGANSASGDMLVGTPSGITGYRVHPGWVYSFSLWFRAVSTVRSCLLMESWGDSSGQQIGDTVIGSSITDSNSGWVQATVSGLAPPNAATVQIMALVQAAATSEGHYIDLGSLIGTAVKSPIQGKKDDMLALWENSTDMALIDNQGNVWNIEISEDGFEVEELDDDYGRLLVSFSFVEV